MALPLPEPWVQGAPHHERSAEKPPAASSASSGGVAGSSPEGSVPGLRPQGSQNPHKAQPLPLLQEVPAQTAVPKVYVTDSSLEGSLAPRLEGSALLKTCPQPGSCSSQNLLGFPEEVTLR